MCVDINKIVHHLDLSIHCSSRRVKHTVTGFLLVLNLSTSLTTSLSLSTSSFPTFSLSLSLSLSLLKVETKKAEPRSNTASAMRLNPTMGFFPGPYGGPDYSGGNGHYGGQWGPAANQQYYSTTYPTPHPGYGPQYSTGGSYPYDHSGYPRTQTSAGDRPADPHQSYYQTQHTYGQQQPGVGGGAGVGGYGHENGGYNSQGRGGFSGGGHGGYRQHSGG
ncbi:hypothetical protein GBAR_LOCUS2825 [Geodia barretti]|nr:hypothetical protein GBAR_LOCUS2825 [Geodia barretti]